MRLSDISPTKQNISSPSKQAYPFFDEDELEYFEERAAIMEFDGGMNRDKAESKAWQLVVCRREAYNKAG